MTFYPIFLDTPDFLKTSEEYSYNFLKIPEEYLYSKDFSRVARELVIKNQKLDTEISNRILVIEIYSDIISVHNNPSIRKFHKITLECNVMRMIVDIKEHKISLNDDYESIFKRYNCSAPNCYDSYLIYKNLPEMCYKIAVNKVCRSPYYSPGDLLPF